MARDEVMIKVPLAEVRELFFLLEETQDFFHQPLNYGDSEQVNAFVKGGFYERVKKAYYETVWNWLPADSQEEITSR
ncbi:MAG: hypothetical protein AAF657_35055 [Acidobacteriota bacterium]